MNGQRIIAITGGIGSGKSVVSKVLESMGYTVYDCDRNAKALMDEDSEIKSRLKAEIHNGAVDDNGNIDRPFLSSIVFNAPDKLKILNSIVHAAVKKDIRRWIEKHNKEKILFVETAILFESGLDAEVNEVWKVTAPMDLRIIRVCERNGVSSEHVKARIASQMSEEMRQHPKTSLIVNDGKVSLLKQINSNLTI